MDGTQKDSMRKNRERLKNTPFLAWILEKGERKVYEDSEVFRVADRLTALQIEISPRGVRVCFEFSDGTLVATATLEELQSAYGALLKNARSDAQWILEYLLRIESVVVACFARPGDNCVCVATVPLEEKPKIKIAKVPR